MFQNSLPSHQIDKYMCKMNIKSVQSTTKSGLPHAIFSVFKLHTLTPYEEKYTESEILFLVLV